MIIVFFFRNMNMLYEYQDMQDLIIEEDFNVLFILYFLIFLIWFMVVIY